MDVVCVAAWGRPEIGSRPPTCRPGPAPLRRPALVLAAAARPCERSIEDADDPLLLGERWVTDFNGLVCIGIQIPNARGVALHRLGNTRELAPIQKPVKEAEIQLVRYEHSQRRREVAERENPILPVEQGNSTDRLLRTAA